MHRRGIIIHAVLQHALASDGDAPLGQAVHRVLRDAGDFIRMIKMSVNHHVFVQRPAQFHDARQCIQPGVIGQDFLRQHGQALGRITQTANVRQAQ